MTYALYHIIRVDWWLKRLRGRRIDGHPVSNGVTGVSLLLFVVILVSFGLGAREELRQLHPGVDPVRFVDRYLIAAIAAVQATGFFTGRSPMFSLRPYLHLPVKRSVMVLAELLKRSFNYRLLVILSVIFPFWLVNVFSRYGVEESIMWLAGVLLINFLFESLFWLLKFFFVSNPLKTFISVASVGGGIFMLDTFGGLSSGFNSLFDELLGGNAVTSVLLPVFVLGFAYVACSFVADNLYIDSTAAGQHKMARVFPPAFVDKRYPLIALQVKSVMRNRLLRYSFLASFGVIAYVVFQFGQGRFDVLMERLAFIALVLAEFACGFFAAGTYGQNAFGLDAFYLGAILSKKIGVENYVRAKFSFIKMSWIFFGLVCAALSVLVGFRFALTVAALEIYMLGVTPYFFLIRATRWFYPAYPDLSPSVFSQQHGFGFSRGGLISLAVMEFPVVLAYLPYFFVRDFEERLGIGLLLISLVGITGLLFNRMMRASITGMFVKRKYGFYEG